MPFLLLAIVAITFIQGEWPAPFIPAAGAVLVQALLLAGFYGAALVIVSRARRRLEVREANRATVLRQAHAFRRWWFVLWVWISFLALYLTGWAGLVQGVLRLGDAPLPGWQLVLLLPMLLGLVLGWSHFYRLEVAVHKLAGQEDDRFPSRCSYIVLQARQNLILAAPPFLLLLLLHGLVFFFPELPDSANGVALVCGGLLGGLFVGQAWLMRLLLGWTPLPASPLRDRLRQVARRLSFRCSDILVWNTHNTMATALLVGPLPFLRYVVLTDRLIANLEAEELEAVFGHEVGHVKHNHMFVYFSLLLASVVLLLAGWNVVLEGIHFAFLQHGLATVFPDASWWGASFSWLIHVPFLMALATYVYLVFGFLSRDGERQADLFACRAVSFPAFLAALERVRVLNGLPSRSKGWFAAWRHPSIGDRIDFLEKMQQFPWLELRFQQKLNLMRGGMAAALGTLFLLVGPERVWMLFG
jgi:STE24 endopeptidase